MPARKGYSLRGPGRFIAVTAASAKRRHIKKCKKGNVACGRKCVRPGAPCHIISLIALPGKRTRIRRAPRKRVARRA